MEIKDKFFGKVRKIFYGKYPVVKQYDRVDCGPAALLSILRYYGGDGTLAHLRELCNTGVDGTSMLGLITAAKILGFEVQGVSGEYEDLMKIPKPFIAHISQNGTSTHYVVIYSVDAHKVLVGDPARGLFRLPKTGFINIWKEKAVVILKPLNTLYSVPSLFWWEWLWLYLKNDVSWLYQSIFLGIFSTVLSLLISLFIQKIIDAFIPSGDIGKIAMCGSLMLFMITLKSLSGYYRQKLIILLNKKFSIKLNTAFITHVLRLPKRFFDTHRTGDITSRINDIIRIQQGLLQVIGVSLIDMVVMAGSLILLFTFSTGLALIVLFVIPWYICYLVITMKKVSSQQHGVMQSYAEVQSTYINTMHCFDEIMSFNAAYFYTEKNRITFYQYQNRLEVLGLMRSKLSLIADQNGNLIMLILLILGSFWVVKGELLLGQMMAGYALAANVLPSINRLVDGSISWQGGSIAVQRLLDLMQINTEKNGGKAMVQSGTHMMICDGAYKWSEQNFLFKNLSISLEKGKITALWGPIGSGKSTIMQILHRKYPLLKGEILIGNRSIQEIDLFAYRGKVAVVPERIKVINGTLAENILLGRQVSDIRDFKNLLRKHNFNDYLQKFERGLFTMLGENGHHLSGGELQMLGLLRALLNEPEILIIDEGLNALDTETEINIFKEIECYARDHFVILCTHSLALISRADYLYVLHHGEIVQQGTPARLIRENGYFKRIWKMWKSKINDFEQVAV